MRNLTPILRNEKGLSTIEAIPLLVVFMVLLFFTFGFFGIVHSALLHNIAARTYALETFRHRTDLTYFRSNRMKQDGHQHYFTKQLRLHGVISETGFDARQTAAERPIALGLSLEEESREQNVHNVELFGQVQTGQRNSSLGVNPVWIMIQYGICLNSECGGN